MFFALFAPRRCSQRKSTIFGTTFHFSHFSQVRDCNYTRLGDEWKRWNVGFLWFDPFTFLAHEFHDGRRKSFQPFDTFLYEFESFFRWSRRIIIAGTSNANETTSMRKYFRWSTRLDEKRKGQRKWDERSLQHFLMFIVTFSTWLNLVLCQNLHLSTTDDVITTLEWSKIDFLDVFYELSILMKCLTFFF